MVRTLTRRELLRNMGRAGLSVAVFGAACQAETTTTTVPQTLRESTTTPPSIFEAPPPPPGPGSEWVRVEYGVATPYLLYKDGTAVLIDTGKTGSGPFIQTALQSVGLDWADLRHVILTHSHGDSISGLSEVLMNAPDANVFGGGPDISSIASPKEIAVARDGDRVHDLTIVETPGHTPGHISVVDQASGILVDGDTISVRRGEFYGPSAETSEDIDLAYTSLRKLTAYDFQTILIGRGEPVLTGGHDVLNLIASLSP